MIYLFSGFFYTLEMHKLKFTESIQTHLRNKSNLYIDNIFLSIMSSSVSDPDSFHFRLRSYQKPAKITEKVKYYKNLIIF